MQSTDLHLYCIHTTCTARGADNQVKAAIRQQMIALASWVVSLPVSRARSPCNSLMLPCGSLCGMRLVGLSNAMQGG